MDREDRRDSRPPHHKRIEAKKKSRSLPPHNRQGGITVDHIAIFAAYEREERRLKDARKEPSSISSDTSCSSLEFIKPNEMAEVKQMAKDSRSSSDHRRSSIDSLSRKDRMEALKARVEAEREKYRESSSDEEVQVTRKLSRYYSDEAIHNVSRDHHKSRSARTERYLKRRSQDESSLWKLGSRRPPAGKTGKSWQESQSHSPLPIVRPKSKCESVSANGSIISHNRSVLMPLNVLTPSSHIETKPQQSPNDSGVSTQSIASSPSSGRAQSPKRCIVDRLQETRSTKNDILSSKIRLHNFSPNDCSRSSSDIRSEKSIASPLSISPVPQFQPDFVHRCRRSSVSDAENCCNHMRVIPLTRMQWPECCRPSRMCCSVPYRGSPSCSSTDNTRKTTLYSYTDQAPKIMANHNSHVKKMISKIQMNGEDKIRLHQPLLAKPLVPKNNESVPKSYETKMPQCPIHLLRTPTLKTPIPFSNKAPEFHSSIPRLCPSVSGQKSPPSPNCRPLSLVIDTLDYLTDPKNYTNCESVVNSPKPAPPVPPIRKYHWTSTLNLSASTKMRLDAMKRTRNSLTSPECEYKVSDSDEIKPSKQNIQSAQKNNAKSTENLDQALKELEEIYKSLKLNDEDLAERAERRDLPTKHQLQYSTGSSSTFSKSEETLQKKPISGSYDCLLVCNRPVRVRAPPFRRSGMSDKVTDDLAYRRFQRVITQNKEDKSEKSQSYLLCNSAFTPGLKVDEYYRDLTSKNQPDVERDDLSYRNYTQSTAARVSPPHPPFGIPLGPTIKSSSNSYLHALPSKPDNRPIYRSQETPDVVRDDMAYRNLRKEDANLHRQRRKHRAVRSLSANIAQLVKQKAEDAKDYMKAQSMTDIIVALEEQSSEWKNLSQLAKNEAVKSPDSSSTEDSTPHFLNNLVSGTSDGLTLSESSSESTKIQNTKIQEKRTQPEGSECLPKVMDREVITKSSSLVDCCRLMSSNRESRKQKTMSVYQPSSSFRYSHDIWSDTDAKSKRKSIGLDESQLDALLTSLSRDTEQKKEESIGLTKSSYGSDLRVTA